jgi:hypothetical protein
VNRAPSLGHSAAQYSGKRAAGHPRLSKV